ncbi:MAG TPA: TonB-dependent receptor [Terracidiphilus sp.]
MRLASLCALLFVIALVAFSANAQIAAGTINVVVEDSTGAIVPGASIKIVNKGTGLEREGIGNERGELSAQFLPVGQYSISVQIAGFKKTTIDQVVLQVDQTASIHVTLQPGEVREVIEVQGVASSLEAETSSLGQVIENTKILELPLNGRNAFALGLLAGNTTPMFGMGSNLPFIAGGGRFSANEVTLDGVDNNTVSNAGSIGRNGIAVTPSVDAVQEFKVKTSTFSAEFGHAAGAVVNATIKSGTNQLHGTVFEFLRNDRLDATNFFTNAAGQAKPAFHQNQFGAAAGGPIVRNRLFLFGDYQGTRVARAGGSSINDIPPAALRAGDFSKVGVVIYDPAARRIGPTGLVISDPLPGNVIPQSAMNASTVAVQQLLPLPNFGAPGALSRNYFYGPPRTSNTDQGDVRVDQIISPKDNVFARFSIADNFTPGVGSYPGFIGGGSDAIDNSQQAVVSYIHIFTPSLVNEARFGFIRHNGSSFGNTGDGRAFAADHKIATLPSPLPGFPGISFIYAGTVSGSAEFSGWGGGDPNLNVENRFQWAENLSWTHGRHTVKTGADIRRERFDVLKGGVGSFVFASTFTSSSNAPGSGLPYADFLYGYPTTEAGNGNAMLDWGRQRSIYAGGFVQDDWKVTSRITLNLGLRYELFTQCVDARDLGSLFDIRSGQFALPGKDGVSRAIVNGDHNNFGPRAGFAYQVSKKLVLRGGYGLFYGERDQNQQVTQFSGNFPNVPVIASPTITPQNTLRPPYDVNTPIPIVAASASLAGFTPASPFVGTIRTQAFDQAADPMVHQYNFNIQYQVTESLQLETSYSGLLGRDLSSMFINVNQIPFAAALQGKNLQANRPFPNINGTVIPVFSNGANNYNAFNFRIDKRYSKGLALLLNYTIQKNMEARGSGPDSYNQNGTSIAMDTYNLSREKSVAPIDVPQILSVSGGYALPFGPGRPWLSHGLAGKLIGGWQVNGILTLRGGFPTNIRTNVIPPIFNTFNVPDAVAGQPLLLPNHGVDGYFNPAAWTVPGTTPSVTGAPIQLFGTAAQRAARGPGSENVDGSIFKNLNFTERHYLQFRTELFNATNTPTFFLPAASNSALTCIGPAGKACNAGNPNFGKLSTGTATGRQIQFGLKYYF